MPNTKRLQDGTRTRVERPAACYPRLPWSVVCGSRSRSLVDSIQWFRPSPSPPHNRQPLSIKPVPQVHLSAVTWRTGNISLIRTSNLPRLSVGASAPGREKSHVAHGPRRSGPMSAFASIRVRERARQC